MDIQDLQNRILQQAKEKGFGVTPDDINVGEKIALLHSEVSEAYDAYRKKNIDGPHGFKEELIDVLQRTLHLCGIFEIDTSLEMNKKLEQNKKREWDWSKYNESNSKD